MDRVVLVTDSTAGLAPDAARDLGIAVVPASFAFSDARRLDSEGSGVYERMTREGVAPRTFGVTEAAFRDAFTGGLQSAESVLCLVAPFDVNPSFTTACAAMLAIQFEEPDARIKVANAGVGSAGLGALLTALAGAARRGGGMDELLALVEELEPRCESLHVPDGTKWLERAGRLQLIEERVGAIDDGTVIVRIGTRITGVKLAEDQDTALLQALDLASARTGAGPVNVCLAHAGAPTRAERFAKAARQSLEIENLSITGMSPTHGAILGPGTVGIGVCPAGTKGS
jgi:DegV family protein with EDD domain